MKRYVYHIFTLIAALLLTTSAWGAISAESTTWTTTTIIENTTITFGKNHTGEITINGMITIQKNCTLTIKFATNYPANTNKVIRAVPNSKGNAFARMFKIETGGSLVIEGRDENSRIILDGGARFSGGLNDKQLLTITDADVDAGAATVHTCINPGGTIKEELIRSEVGSLTLKWVTMQNVFAEDAIDGYTGENSYGGAIHLTGTVDDEDTHLTLLENCIIENCADHCGGAMAIRMSNNDAPKDTYPDNTKVTLTNTEIRYCYTSSSSGGTIRANGRTINDVELKNVEIHHNYTKSSGAGLLWNGGGSSETDMLINGGSFHHNVSGSKGGAMSISANISFKGDVIIEYNHAKTDGGGISIHTYDGVVMPKRDDKTYNFTYTFPKGLIIRNNYSQKGGGIAYNVDNFAIYKDWPSDPQTGVVINTTLDLQGAEISNNTAISDGGGIWLANNLETGWTTKNEAKANIYVHLNSGSINDNTSKNGNGAGVYLYKTDISHVVAKAGTLSLDSNKANGTNKNGGGIYIENGKIINLSNVTTEIKNNQASNGGAIYLNGTSGVQVTMGTTTMEANEVTGSGGAVYVKGGNLLLNRATILNNSAVAKGGAIYIDGGGIDIINTVKFSSNTAGEDGGAVYVDGGQFSASSTVTINSNSAGGDGGAIYVTGTSSNRGNININGNSANKATITGNYSTGEGGAFYVNNGDITMGLTELSGNGKDATSVVRTVNGGAIALKNGKFSFADGSEIKDNHATGNGGGLYISNDSATSISCVGGSYINNSAGYGGGLYASGPIILQFAANMQSNRAVNGGGMYLAEGINMTFGVNEQDLKLSGLIVGNEAKGEGENGVGGGVYLAKGTLRFALSDDFKDLGIYNNSASYEAADIYSSGGSETTVHLPNVSGMNLTGFDVPGSDLYWVRDFSEKRYETLLRNNQDIADLIVSFDGAPTLVLASEQCLDLGYDLVFVTLIPVGLDAFDNAAVTISYPHKTTGDPTQYRKVVLHGTEPQIVGLPSNHWQFDATPWSFTYQIPTYDPPHAAETSGTERKDYILIKRNHNQEINISFSQNQAQKSYVTHDVLVVNPMRPGGSNN